MNLISTAAAAAAAAGDGVVVVVDCLHYICINVVKIEQTVNDVKQMNLIDIVAVHFVHLSVSTSRRSLKRAKVHFGHRWNSHTLIQASEILFIIGNIFLSLMEKGVVRLTGDL
ncbi:conserved hypothetical protein [Trichinella spiralis]|uniref:hypothetical protein n=1 Tax=Trichinella spiralis TaxID=6334 RepID=UPI0001EFD715|nr:conserved hypothetical protein [Trichinella spiralis]